VAHYSHNKEFLDIMEFSESWRARVSVSVLCTLTKHL